MAAPLPVLVEDDKVGGVELIESVQACVDHKPPNTTEIHASSSSSGNNAPDTNTNNGHGDACESLVFEQFITACTPHLKIPGDERIIEKLRRYYSKINVECIETSEFASEMSRFTLQVNTSDIYILIQELLVYFKSCNAKAASKKQAHIKKLENYLQKLDEKIKELQAREVDLDDEDNSDFLLECRYKKRFAYVYGKLCDIVGYSKDDPKPKLEYNGTRFPEINRNISRYLRKTDQFPDLQDIHEIITETNEKEGLHLTDITIMTREVFKEVGIKLKKRRIEDFEANFGSTLTDHIEVDDNNDPATLDADLREKLARNQQLATKRLNEVMDSYAFKQDMRGEEGSRGSNEEDNDEEEDDDDDDDVEEEEEEIDDLDDANLLIEIEDSRSPELPSGIEDSKINHPLTNSTKDPPLEPEAIQEIKPSSEPSKNGFLAELDVKPNIKLTTSPKSELSNEVIALTNRESNSTNLNSSNLLRAVKRGISCVDHEDTAKLSVKRKVPIQPYIDDDDVIVLSD